ncbi:MAG: YitT family protein [Ruminococcaceae bacterium]|nr:YitT family protein [Oscillospiraceae bacterium]
MNKLSVKNFILLTIAGAVNAFGVTFFLAPVKLYDSGVSGTSMLLSQITPEWMSLSLFLLILNIPLFLYGLKRQGKEFTIYAVYTVTMYSLFAYLITDVFPIDVSAASPLAESDLLLCALFGGLISGAGSGLAIRFGGAMDGIEVLAVIFAKRLGVTVGTFVMTYNVVLYVVCGLILQSWILPLYSIVAYMAALKTVDFIVEGFDRSKAAMIITSNPNEVAQRLSEEFGCGMTLIDAKGFYSSSKMTAIYFIVNRFQVGKMKSIVHEYDPKAYITISEIANVFSSNADK